MAQLTRQLMKIFGINAGPTQIGKFGSLAAGLPAYASTPEEVQDLANWEEGWNSAVLGNNSPAMEDMNGAHFVMAYQLAYLFQQGIAEWNTDTEYFIGGFVSSGGVLYVSQTDNNLGNDPTGDIVNWQPYANVIEFNSGLLLKEIVPPATPDATFGKLYLGEDKLVKVVDDDGATTRFDSSFINLKMVLNAGTFTIKGANDEDLSDTNYGYLVMKSAVTAGLTVKIKITANVSFRDDAYAGTSDIAGEYFDKPSGETYNQNRPFYVYVVNGDDTSAGVRIMLSPCWTLERTPVGTKIAYKLNPASTHAIDTCFFLTGTDPTSSHAQKPCELIGGIQMQGSAGNDWTVQVFTYLDGVNSHLPYAGVLFTLPTGFRGANSGGYLLGIGGGTPPTWGTPANVIAKFSNLPGGNTMYQLNTNTAGVCSNGSGAFPVAAALPYLPQSGGSDTPYGTVLTVYDAALTFIGIALMGQNIGLVYFTVTNAGTTTTLGCAGWTNGADDITFTVTYKSCPTT